LSCQGRCWLLLTDGGSAPSGAACCGGQIVNWRTHLKFPEEANLSREARDLICRLLCDVEHRLGTRSVDDIKVRPLEHRWRHSIAAPPPPWFTGLKGLLCLSLGRSELCYNMSLLMGVIVQRHPWFKGLEWERLYEMEAAFVPEVKDELDTQNFEKFEEVQYCTVGRIAGRIAGSTMAAVGVVTLAYRTLCTVLWAKSAQCCSALSHFCPPLSVPAAGACIGVTKSWPLEEGAFHSYLPSLSCFSLFNFLTAPLPRQSASFPGCSVLLLPGVALAWQYCILRSVAGL